MPSPERDPYENVVFIDEYPNLAKKVWLRRLHEERMGKVVTEGLVFLPTDVDTTPDEPA